VVGHLNEDGFLFRLAPFMEAEACENLTCVLSFSNFGAGIARRHLFVQGSAGLALMSIGHGEGGKRGGGRRGGGGAEEKEEDEEEEEKEEGEGKEGEEEKGKGRRGEKGGGKGGGGEGRGERKG
jgi:hypothetical protein